MGPGRPRLSPGRRGTLLQAPLPTSGVRAPLSSFRGSGAPLQLWGFGAPLQLQRFGHPSLASGVRGPLSSFGGPLAK